MDIRQPSPTILIADDEADITAVLSDILSGQGYRVDTAADGSEAWQKLQDRPFEAVITDLKMPRMGGLELLRRVTEAGLPPAVIMMTGFATVETAIEALKIGAYDYIMKPFKVSELLQVVDRAIEKVRLAAENLQLKEQISLLRLSEAVASKLDLDEILGIVVDAALKEVNADGVELLFRPTGSTEFTRRVSQGRDGPVPPAVGDIRGLERTLDGAPHVQLRGDMLAPLLSPEAAGRVSTLLSIPLKRGGDVLGVLNAYTGLARHSFLPREEKALLVLGDRAASSLENALLYSDLETALRDTINSLAEAVEAKDPYTRGHSERVTEVCGLIAEVMGVDDDTYGRLRQAGKLHDIGKIGTPTAILNKKGPLDADEMSVIRKHPATGMKILQPISFLKGVPKIVYHHHERWDGSGYPEGISGHEIPIEARIMAVADTYEAMSAKRVYRGPQPYEKIENELKAFSGTQFDPECVEAFLRLHPSCLPEPKVKGPDTP